MFKYPLIIFEGIEGSGKTTQINNVIKELKLKKRSFIKIREPGGCINSEKIRRLILNKKSNFNNLTDLFLYLASRNENIEKILKKNYKKKIVLIDRFIFSTIAYQHYGMGINRNLIEKLNSIILQNIKPTHIFLHTTSMNNLNKRLKLRKRINRYDTFKLSFYKRVQDGFLNTLKHKKNVTIVNSNMSLISNKNQIIKKVLKLI